MAHDNLRPGCGLHDAFYLEVVLKQLVQCLHNFFNALLAGRCAGRVVYCIGTVGIKRGIVTQQELCVTESPVATAVPELLALLLHGLDAGLRSEAGSVRHSGFYALLYLFPQDGSNGSNSRLCRHLCGHYHNFFFSHYVPPR